MASPERLISSVSGMLHTAICSPQKKGQQEWDDSTMKGGNKAEAVGILSYTFSTEKNGF